MVFVKNHDISLIFMVFHRFIMIFHENHDLAPRFFYFFEKKRKFFLLRFFNPGLKTPKPTRFLCGKCGYTIIIRFENAWFSEFPTVLL